MSTSEKKLYCGRWEGDASREGERGRREGREKYASFCGSKGFSATEKIADLYEVDAAVVDEAVAADQSVPIGIGSH
jgi:hypothetical protein